MTMSRISKMLTRIALKPHRRIESSQPFLIMFSGTSKPHRESLTNSVGRINSIHSEVDHSLTSSRCAITKNTERHKTKKKTKTTQFQCIEDTEIDWQAHYCIRTAIIAFHI